MLVPPRKKGIRRPLMIDRGEPATPCPQEFEGRVPVIRLQQVRLWPERSTSLPQCPIEPCHRPVQVTAISQLVQTNFYLVDHSNPFPALGRFGPSRPASVE